MARGKKGSSRWPARKVSKMAQSSLQSDRRGCPPDDRRSSLDTRADEIYEENLHDLKENDVGNMAYTRKVGANQARAFFFADSTPSSSANLKVFVEPGPLAPVTATTCERTVRRATGA